MRQSVIALGAEQIEKLSVNTGTRCFSMDPDNK